MYVGLKSHCCYSSSFIRMPQIFDKISQLICNEGFFFLLIYLAFVICSREPKGHEMWYMFFISHCGKNFIFLYSFNIMRYFTSVCLDFFIYGRNCCQIFLVICPHEAGTWDPNYTPWVDLLDHDFL